jgi:hypothetical protein
MQLANEEEPLGSHERAGADEALLPLFGELDDHLPPHEESVERSRDYFDQEPARERGLGGVLLAGGKRARWCRGQPGNAGVEVAKRSSWHLI